MQLVSAILGTRHQDRDATSDTRLPPWIPRRELPRRWWIAPLVVFLTARVFNTVMMAVASEAQMTWSQFLAMGLSYHVAADAPAPAGILGIATNWDGQWYWDIATRGYPTTLPRDASGTVSFNAWAFYPLYPLTVRGVMRLTGLGFPASAMTTSITFGALATVLVHRLVARRQGQRAGLAAAIGVNTFICAPVLQIAYTEAMALFLILTILYLVLTRRYGWAAAAVLPLALSRGIIAPLAPALLIYALLLWRRSWGNRRDYLSLVLLSGWAGALSFAWIFIAGSATGVPDAYRETQRAWNPSVDVPAVVRFVRESSDIPGGVVTATLVTLVFCATLVAIFTWRQHEPLLGLWTASYVLYLLALVDWNPSTIRYYLLALPVFWPVVNGVARDPKNARSAWAAVMVLAGTGLVLQWWWIRYTLVLSPELVQVP
jgi:hypothetical protein